MRIEFLVGRRSEICFSLNASLSRILHPRPARWPRKGWEGSPAERRWLSRGTPGAFWRTEPLDDPTPEALASGDAAKSEKDQKS
jgi:hypothetical protein